jgi:ABC-2 type transport system permease protein
MFRLDFGRVREWAGFLVIIETAMGAGMALMYGFFYPHVTPSTALYIATGAPTLALIPLGFVMLPSNVAQQRTDGTFDYTWSLPVPRSAQAAATFLLFSGLALPGCALSLAVATVRYGVHLELSPLLVPAVLLSSLLATTVGYGMALAVSNPLVVQVVTNALVFVVLLFSPIVYPASQLPGWLAALHRVLPFYNMAVVIRAGLTVGVVGGVLVPFLVLGAWTLAGVCATAYVVGRRR